jgi:hypothetical protein
MRLVEVDDGVELLRQPRVEVVGDALRLGPVDDRLADVDVELEEFPLQAKGVARWWLGHANPAASSRMEAAVALER